MSTQIDVLKAKTEQLEILTEETLMIDPELRSNESLSLGDQVRISVKSDSEKYGNFTLKGDYQDGTDNDDVRARLSGRQRLDQSDSFDAYIDALVVQQGKTKQWLDESNEFGEFLDETDSVHSDFVVCAPHGGVIENYTDEQAEACYNRLLAEYSKDASSWRCCGWQDGVGAFAAFHTTSTEIARNSFPKLDQIGDRNFAHAVAFHGWGEDGILIGGGAPADLKCTLRAAIEAACGGNVEVAITTGGAYSGTDPDNLVNWLTAGGAGGIQIEQSYYARQTYGIAIAEAVADVLAAL